MAAAGLSLKVAVEPGLTPVRGRGDELAQVLLNLLTNAMDATPPGGHVEMAARATPDRSGVEIEVRDSGPGIPADRLQQIFEPFFSTKAGRGTGLGLAIAAKIVRDLGGRIEVDSAEGVGSCFRVTLPVATQPAAGAGP